MMIIKKFKYFNAINEKRVPRDERVELYKDDNIIVVVPLTHRSLMKYSNSCQWCIQSDTYEWEEYHKGEHCIIIQRDKKKDKIGITGIPTSSEIFFIAKFDHNESTFEDVCGMLNYDFISEEDMMDYYLDLTKDIDNFSTNIVYYSPRDSIYDMDDNYLSNFNLSITDIPNLNSSIIKTIDNYFIKLGV